MFVKSCFVRSNSIELIRKLEHIGYTFSGIGNYSSPIIATTKITSEYSLISDYSIDTTNPHHTWNCVGRIDCDENEDLFLAIAALRDDTDENQWFMSDEGTFKFNKDNIFNIGMSNYTNYNFTHWHKATVNELIEHFK